MDRNLLLTRSESRPDWMSEGRRVLDLAQGILIAHRRYPADAAFAELVAVARGYDVSVSAVAAGLLMLATGSTHGSAPSPEASVVARLAWGFLLGG